MAGGSLRFVIGTLDRGGTETHLLGVLPALSKRGWQIDILVLRRGGAIADHFRREGIRVAEPPVWMEVLRGPGRRLIWALCLVFWLIYHFVRDRKSILHFFLPEAYMIGGVCAWLVRYPAPMLMSRRSLNRYQAKYRGARQLEIWLHRKMSRIIGNSRAVVEQLHREEGVPEGKLELIYNGVDPGVFRKHGMRKEMRRKLGVGEETLVMVMVANLIPYKGHADLVDALAYVRDTLPAGWLLWCVGYDSGILDELKERARNAGVAERIRWLGARDDVPHLLCAADIGILCSHEEGFSNAILEYMVAGLPVVATKVGGNAEAVLHGETGWIVSPRNPIELGERLLDIAQNEGRQKNFGAAGRRRVEALFSMKKCIASYEAVYRSLV